MVQPGPEKKGDAKARSAEKRAAAKLEKNRQADQLRTQTTAQLEAARSAVKRLEEEILSASKTAASRDALSSHLRGFYLELDKLTKGKALIPVTDLIVERINDAVRDAKVIVKEDLYLERVKEFVPAGDNPVYPDVLLTARTIQESLERFKQYLEVREKHVLKMLREAKTIQAAAQYYLDNEVIPSKEQVQAIVGGKSISDSWFLEDENGEEAFDFDRLDKCQLEEYFSVVRAREAR